MPATEKPHALPGEVCPFHQKDVSKVCHKCPLWIHMRGTDPQTGADRDEWGCAFAWTPVLLVENAQQQRQTGAALESLRNEARKDTRAQTEAMAKMAAGFAVAARQAMTEAPRPSLPAPDKE